MTLHLEKKVIRYKRELRELTPGTKVSVLWNDGKFSLLKQEIWTTATILDLLSVQFTAAYDHVDGNPVTYCFYDAVGDSWRPIE